MTRQRGARERDAVTAQGCQCILLVLLLLLITACSGKPINTSPEIGQFLAEHPDFGKVVDVQPMPDWAQGKRERVTLDVAGKRRTLLFYVKDRRVVTVYEDGQDGRQKVWGDYDIAEPTPPVAKEASQSLPAYTVLFANKKMGTGGKFGDILIPSISRKTPAETREKVFRDIAAKEQMEDASFYSSEEAYRANTTSSFAASHPGAMRKGFLGSLKGAVFTPGEKLYP